MKILLTLSIVYDHPRILLGMKKKRFGAGRWNGFGGKLEKGETIEQSAKRELKEESGLEALELVKRGIINFEFENTPEVLEVHIFQILKWKGELQETEEMKPKWFHLDEIPFGQMWPSDAYWMPLFLRGKSFKSQFLFDRPSTADYSSEIIDYNLDEMEALES